MRCGHELRVKNKERGREDNPLMQESEEDNQERKERTEVKVERCKTRERQGEEE